MKPRLSLFMLFVLAVAFFAACTDYVEQVDGQIAEFNEHENARLESMRHSAEYWVNPVDVLEDSLFDERDAKTYRTVAIGSQTWMAENLNYEVEGSYCYNGVDSNCTKYGRLYMWAAAMDGAGQWSDHGKGCGYDKLCAPKYPVKGVCPDGWHIPSSGDWETLLMAANYDLQGYSYSANELKSKKGWGTNASANDLYLFSAFPVGIKMNNGKYYYEGSRTAFWTSTEQAKKQASAFRLGFSSGAALEFCDKDEGYSVRCIKDVLNEYTATSSSEFPGSSSSSSITDGTWFLWNAFEAPDGFVVTGFADESGTSGYWYDYSDTDVGGKSVIMYPKDVEENDFGQFFPVLAETYGGLKGMVSFGDGFEFPYAGLAFNVVGETRRGADIHEWGGLCLSYMSNTHFIVEIVTEEDAFVSDDLNSFRASLPKHPSVDRIDIPWERFRQPAFRTELKNIDDVLSKVAVIKLHFDGETGNTVDFLVNAIGSLGQCPRPD